MDYKLDQSLANLGIETVVIGIARGVNPQAPLSSTFLAKKKLNKLQRGSVKGFISDNKQISKLNVISNSEQDEIEKILQIRHLYAHKNGIVDEKFLSYYPGMFSINDEHSLTVEDLLKHFLYLLESVDRIDKAAILKYQLSTL